MSDTDTLARLAYEAFYAALDQAHAPWGWTHLRPQVQQAWRVVVETVQAAPDARQGEQ